MGAQIIKNQLPKKMLNRPKELRNQFKSHLQKVINNQSNLNLHWILNPNQIAYHHNNK